MTPPILWTEKPDRLLGPHTSGTLFEWMGRIDDDKFERARRQIESSFQSTPDSMQADIQGRLQSKDYHNFYSAFSELWFRDVFEAQGFHCMDASQVIAGSKPDWLLAASHSPIAIAECFVGAELPENVRVDRIKRRWLNDARERMNDKIVQLEIEQIISGSGEPGGRDLAKRLDELAPTVPDFDAGSAYLKRPTYLFTDKTGWAIHFKLLRFRCSTPGTVRPLIALETDEVRWGTKESRLTAQIRKKSKQHRHTRGLPVVLCFHWHQIDHTFDFNEVRRVVIERSDSMIARGAYALLWAPMVFPWGSDLVDGPTLLHWNAPELAPFLDVWNGASVNVLDSETPVC